MEWLYPRRIVNKLIESFSPKTNDTANSTYHHDGPVLPTIWIHLPYIGKKGTLLVKSCTRKISRLLKSPCKFTTTHDTTNSNTFLSLKDRTQKELQSSVVYKFICPGCKGFIRTLEKLTVTAVWQRELKNTLIARTQKFTSISTTVNISFILRH